MELFFPKPFTACGKFLRPSAKKGWVGDFQRSAALLLKVHLLVPFHAELTPVKAMLYSKVYHYRSPLVAEALGNESCHLNHLYN
jgi:hypothetical protein